MNFKKVELEDKKIFDEYFKRGFYEGSECTFTNMYMWGNPYQIMWCEHKNALIIQAKRDDKIFFLPPFLKEEGNLLEIINDLKKSLCIDKISMHGIYESTIKLFEKHLELKEPILEDIDNWDYIYDRDKLANLSGRKMHSKKNHLNAFKKENPNFVYEKISQKNIGECLDFAKIWFKEKELDSSDEVNLSFEYNAIKEVFESYDSLDVKGGLIRIDGKVQAFTFGENVNDNMVVVHVEKANPKIRGLYTAINQQFVFNDCKEVSFINREEDMGILGLKKAKESYKPIYMVKKYITSI